MADYTIIDSDYLDKDNNLINEIISQNTYSKELVFNSEKWSSYLRNYLLLTHNNDLASDRLSLYLSRYYWFKKFYQSYALQNGIDVGIEQQIVHLLEEIGNEFKDFDWDLIKELNEKINEE